MEPPGLFVRRLGPDDSVDFECADPDLNDFFHNKRLDYLKERLAITYVIENGADVIAMFSLCNDRIDIHDFGDNHKLLKKAAKNVPHPKRGLKNFPAVKIGRLGVRTDLQGKHGIGTAVVVFIQALFTLRNKTGCRFLTVDSYPNATGFYEKKGFTRVNKPEDEEPMFCPSCDAPYPPDEGDEHESKDHVLMYLDLTVLEEEKLENFKPVVDELISSSRARLPSF